MCNFLLEKLSNEQARDGSSDIKVLENLKDDAADIQFDRVKKTSWVIDGLSDYIGGSSVVPKKE